MTNTRHFVRGLAAIALLATLPNVADAAMQASGKPKISFFAEGNPGALDIEGVTNTVTVTDDGTKLAFTVPMKSVKTGIDLRDTHMCDEYVQVGQFPNAVLTLNKADVQWGTAIGERKEGKVQGTFNIHGVDQPVTVDYSTQKSKTGYRVTGKFAFNTDKSGIAHPTYLGVGVEPDMHAEVTIDLIDA